MMDINKQLFSMALGIQEPIYLEGIKFEEGELHIHLDFYRSSEFACPRCGGLHKVYDTREKVWRHLNFFQYKCYLHFPVPRTDCPQCGKLQHIPAWTREQSGFTLLFEAFIVALAKAGLPFSELSNMTGENDTRLRRIIDHYVEEAYKARSFAEVTRLGIDETSSKKGHRYITVVTNQDDGTVIFATEGKDAETLKRFVQEAQQHGMRPENVTEVSMDMSQAFQNGVTDNLPGASITFDRFHVMKLLNEAVDKVRRNEQNQSPELKNALKKSRYVWLKNPDNLTQCQRELLESLQTSNLLTAEAYRLKLAFQEIYASSGNADTAALGFSTWMETVQNSKLEPLIHFADTLKKHLSGVLRFFTSRITNGISEGLNSIIGQVKRRARGYTNMRHFINTIYLVVGGLSLPDLAHFGNADKLELTHSI
jgi:transposase